MAVRVALVGMLLLGGLQSQALELPWWIDSVEVSLPGEGGIGAVSLSGTWIDTGAPDAISHSILDGALHLSVSAPDLNVPTGDALTPWSLTEEFGPLDPFAGFGGVNEIQGSIFSVDPNNRGLRQLVSGPDFLGWIEPPPRGEFHGLGVGVSSGYVTAAFDVSADGRVVAGADQLAPYANGLITSEAFAWSPQTGKVSLGLLPGGIPGGSQGFGVSADGNHVVGVSTSGQDVSVDREAFRWSLGSGMEGLGTINGPSSTSEARAVSSGGQVVVGVDDFYPPLAGPQVFSGRRAFRYTDEGGMQDLGVLPEYQTSEAVDVSANGRVVVGNSERYPSDAAIPFQNDLVQPFRWTEGDGMVGLGNLPRFFPAVFLPPQQETVANAVSADGRVVVGLDRVYPIYSTAEPLEDGIEYLPINLFPAAETAAVRWTAETGWTDLGQLQTDALIYQYQSAAEATDVSGDGSLVIGSATIATPCPVCDCAGDFCGTTEEVPFLWDEDRGMRPLARVLAGDFGLDFDGWLLGEAAAISDDGTTIVGTGTNPDGVQEAWRAVLQRNTRLGDADFDGDVDRYDHDALMANLGQLSGDEPVYYEDGDFDANGTVDEDDMLLLMANYDGRQMGDFNADGVVDSADYTVWRDHLGSETGIADSTGDGLANESDLAAWRANFGRTLGNLSATAVPEPSALLTLLLGSASAGLGRRRLGG